MCSSDGAIPIGSSIPALSNQSRDPRHVIHLHLHFQQHKGPTTIRFSRTSYVYNNVEYWKGSNYSGSFTCSYCIDLRAGITGVLYRLFISRFLCLLLWVLYCLIIIQNRRVLLLLLLFSPNSKR